MPRPQFLATLRDAAVVVLPSLVEASPLTPLEACAMTPRVVMSDIVAHHEVLAPFGDAAETGQAAFFDTRNAVIARRGSAQCRGGRCSNHVASPAELGGAANPSPRGVGADPGRLAQLGGRREGRSCVTAPAAGWRAS